MAETMVSMIQAQRIRQRVGELGREISNDYGPDGMRAVVVLAGGFMFASDLLRGVGEDVRLRAQVDFVRASSYGAGTTSSGDVRIAMDPGAEFEGQHVLLIDDVLDTGETLWKLYGVMKNAGAKTVRTAVLLHKVGKQRHPVMPSYVGFEIDDVFVVGYGMDKAGRYRGLPDVRRLV